MSSATAVIGVPANLREGIAKLDAAVLPHERRQRLLDRAFELRSGREKPNRFWKIDLDALDYSAIEVAPAAPPEIVAPPGVLVCDLATAARERGAVVGAALGSSVDLEGSKFAALAAALCNTGVFVYVPRGVALSEPIEIFYHAQGFLFPYSLIVLEQGAECIVVEHVRGESAQVVAGVSEICAGGDAHITYAAIQELGPQARIFTTRGSAPGANAGIAISIAELGSALSVGAIDVSVANRGVDVHVDTLFFPRDDQHVDVISTIDHRIGDSQSQTLVKSAATGRGQARYLGNIRIAPHAQATQAALRDDALLLSKRAHIDSVPALEIAANDVKAYHGATVGALDEDQIFYMTSRGITREDAETMIALGFFEPVVERFPTRNLRERIREALQQKVGR